MHTYPIALGMFKSPGEFGVDIATGEGQPLGVPLTFGGAYVGLFTAKQQLHSGSCPGASSAGHQTPWVAPATR